MIYKKKTKYLDVKKKILIHKIIQVKYDFLSIYLNIINKLF